MVKGIGGGMTLDEIAIKYNCDKSSLHHDYCRIYEMYLEKYRNEPISFLELGYGGYDDPNNGGESARMWREYFRMAEITVVDLYWKDNVPNGVGFIHTSQDESTLSLLPKQNIILDDASHINYLTIASFRLLWDRLISGGLYIIEDLHSSYDTYYPDANPNPNEGNTAMNFLKRLTDELNADYLADEHKLGYEVDFIHFYKNLVIIGKK